MTAKKPQQLIFSIFSFKCQLTGELFHSFIAYFPLRICQCYTAWPVISKCLGAFLGINHLTAAVWACNTCIQNMCWEMWFLFLCQTFQISVPIQQHLHQSTWVDLWPCYENSTLNDIFLNVYDNAQTRRNPDASQSDSAFYGNQFSSEENIR